MVELVEESLSKDCIEMWKISFYLHDAHEEVPKCFPKFNRKES